MINSYGCVVSLQVVLSCKKNFHFSHMDPMQLWTEGISNCATTSTKENAALPYHVDTDMSVTEKTVLAHTQASGVQAHRVPKVDSQPGVAINLVDPSREKLFTQSKQVENNNHCQSNINNHINLNPSSNSKVVTPINLYRLTQT